MKSGENMPIFRQRYRFRSISSLCVISFVFLSLYIGQPLPDSNPIAAASAGTSQKVNVPYLGIAPPPASFTPAIFWLGEVSPTSNYADVRIYYYDAYLKLVVHIIDRSLWYDTAKNPAEITQWDSVSIYLNQDGNIGSTPGYNSYLFQLQLAFNQDDPEDNLKVSYRGNGVTWMPAVIPITSYSEWRGKGSPNSDSDNEGWVAYYEIPFSSLGLSGPPTRGTLWGLGVIIHDRDDAAGSIRQDTSWPETINSDNPSTWNQLSFGAANYIRPRALPIGTITIRQGLNGAIVNDGAVGGGMNCGNDGADKWTAWGNANYDGQPQINIQNQWDIADWPCFSKYYITFPAVTIPSGTTIISASLSMYLFGGAGGGDFDPPQDSYIEAFTVDRDWDRATLSWNNAPQALENITGTWVHPIPSNEWVLYKWDVSLAVLQAYNSGTPLRLALYSIDGAYHSGKYFWSSYGDPAGLPTLQITYGTTCDSPGVTCYFSYLPNTFK